VFNCKEIQRMLINVLRLPSILKNNSVDIPMFNKFGNRISTGYECIDGEYVRIPISKLDNANVVCIENNFAEKQGMLRLATKDRLIKKIIVYITGTKAGYVYIESKYLYGLLS